MRKKIKIVAFDCDGVLFDTKKANMAYYNQILNHFDRPVMTDEQFAYVNMHTVDASLSYLFNNKKILDAAHAYRKNMGYFKFLKYMEIEPYLKPLLEKLRPEYKTAIATNRTDTMDGLLLEHDLKGYFDLVVTALDVDHPKPHPEPLVKILDHFNVEPGQAIYVGDSELDEIAAKMAGIPLVAYNNSDLSAEFHIKSLKELEDILWIADKIN